MAPLALRLSTVTPLRASTRAAVRAAAPRRVSVVRAFIDSEDAKASIKETQQDVMNGASELADKVAAYWEASEEKPTIVAVGFGTLLAIYFLGNVVDAVDRLPLVSTVFELIGLTFTGWTAYRYFLVAGEKQKMTSEIKSFASKVGIDL